MSEADREEQRKFVAAADEFLSRPLESFDGPALREQSREYQATFWRDVKAYRASWERAKLMTPAERREAGAARSEAILATCPPGFRLGPAQWHPDGSWCPFMLMFEKGWTLEKLRAWRKERGIDMPALIERWKAEGFGNGGGNGRSDEEE